jgi:tungstate transport system substrate-binding protein
VEVSVVGNPTQLAIELGVQKAADLLITHAPRQEAGFINSGGALDSAQVFESRFVVLGPKRWLGVVTGFEAPEAFRAFAQAEQSFVSRGDGSGTNDAEDLVWLESGLNPAGEDWYLETGQGMGPTILVADQRDAVTLAEIGSFIAAEDTITIVDLVLDEGGLENPYTSIVVRGSEGEQLASEFHQWLLSAEGIAAILDANEELFGAIVYSPPSG